MNSFQWCSRLVITLVAMLALFSCKKENFKDAAQLWANISSDGRIEDQARLVGIVKHQRSSPVRGYHSDEALDTTKAVGTPFLMRTGGINFNGNSLFANMIDDTAWRFMSNKWDVVNRAAAGSMWTDLYTHRDSLLFDYNSRQYVFYMGENEISYYINTRPTWTVAQLTANDSIVIKSTIFEFNRVYDALRSKYPGVSILIVSPNHCPFHVSRGMTRAIDSIAAAYKRKIAQDAAQGNKAEYIEMNGINDNPNYYRDSIHFKIPSNAYGNWAAKIKPYLLKRTSQLPVEEPSGHPVIVLDSLSDFPSPIAGGPTVRIVGDYQTNGAYTDTASATVKGYLYLRLNALSSTAASGWLTSLKWSQISGPTTVTFEKPASGNTLVNNLAKGTYYFQVAVTDSKGKINYGRLVATFK